MNYLIKIKNNSSKLIFYIFFLVNLSVLKAYSTESTYKIFFSENHMYLEKNNFLLSLPYKIKLEENLNQFEKNWEKMKLVRGSKRDLKRNRMKF